MRRELVSFSKRARSVADTFDYVIVGSGPAGSLLANRLTEGGAATACVLEAGIRDRSPLIRIHEHLG